MSDEQEKKPRRKRSAPPPNDQDESVIPPTEEPEKPARRKRSTPDKTETASKPAAKPKAAEVPKKDAAALPRRRAKTAEAEKSAKKAKKPSAPLWPIPKGRLARTVWLGRILVRFAPVWLVACIALVILGPSLLRSLRSATMGRSIAPLFTPEVQYWAPQIAKWAAEYDVNPNLIATLMQIESCGYPGAASNVGAQGLFQVMPMHFTDSENMTDPETNARRGIGVILDCLNRADGDVGLAMACYNGGPRLISLNPASWPAESQRYYRWGGGIYNDAIQGASQSTTLQNWLDAGGIGLCRQAATALGLSNAPTARPPDTAIPPTSTKVLPTLEYVAPPQTLAPNNPSPPGTLPTFVPPSNTPAVKLFLTPSP